MLHIIIVQSNPNEILVSDVMQYEAFQIMVRLEIQILFYYLHIHLVIVFSRVVNSCNYHHNCSRNIIPIF